jgi:putative ABC transport system ATP-binding protein
MNRAFEVRPRPDEPGEVLAHELEQELPEVLLHEAAAVLSYDGADEPPLLLNVLDQAVRKAERAVAPWRGRLRAEKATESVEPADEHVFLVGVVRVKGRAPDVRPVAKILHADGVPAALEDELDERFRQEPPGSLHAPVAALGSLHAAPARSWTVGGKLSGTGRLRAECRLRASPFANIVDSMSTNERLVHLIELRAVTKTYPVAGGGFTALDRVSLTLRAGELTAIVGKSGSGKSTLIHLIAGIDRPTRGEIVVGGTQVHALDESALAAWRGRNVGVVFQFFQLLPTLTVVENVLLPMDFCATYPPKQARARAFDLLERVGIADQADKLPSALSGGQQQRAAIARALANDPPLVVADEPTGNLDSRTADAVLELLVELAGAGKTVVVVTHERDWSRRFHSVVTLVDGRVTGMEGRKPRQLEQGVAS